MRRDVAGSSARSRKEREPAPATGSALLAELWRDTATPVLLLDASGGVIFSNRAFEERIGMMRDFGKSLDALYAAFLDQRAGSGWESQTSKIRRRILQSSRATGAVAALV